MPTAHERKESDARDSFAPQDFSDQNSELLTLDELAGILKVPRSWIYAHTRSKSRTRLPYLKIGKYLRFYESEVREFLRQLRSRY